MNHQTVDTGLRAVSLLHRLPMAHFNIGVAMARSGESDRVILAFQTALRFQPNMVNAHRYLATLHRDNGGDSDIATFHQQEAAKIIRSRPRARTAKAERTEKPFDLPKIPKREEQLKILLRERPDPKPDEKRSAKNELRIRKKWRRSLMPRCIGKNLVCSLKGTALAIPATKSDWRFHAAAGITHAKRLHHHCKRSAAFRHFADDADASCWRSLAVNGQPARRG